MSRLALAALIAFTAGCGELVLCPELAAELESCDVRPAALRCDLISFGDRYELKQRLEQHGCAGLWSDDGAAVESRFCRAFDWSCPPALGPESHPTALNHPLVFVRGIDGNPDLDWNPRILDALSAQDHEVVHARLSSWAPREIRAQELWSILRQLSRGRPEVRVNLICYAVAGLDCRYLVSPGGLFAGDEGARTRVLERVASITTIATPHRGTDVASAALYGSDEVLDALFGPRAVAGPGRDQDFAAVLQELAPDALVTHNERWTDAPEVFYQSWAGVSHVLGQPLYPSQSQLARFCVDSAGNPALHGHPNERDVMTELLWVTSPFAGRTIARNGQSVIAPHDGMVSVESARWGVFRGCLPADHYDVIGQVDDGGPDPASGFDAVRFYQHVVDTLVAEGL